MFTHLRFCLIAACLLYPLGQSSTGQEVESPKNLTLQTGDRVVFLGNSFFERAIDNGSIETSLSLRWPTQQIVFRNLGWDGDTVYGHSHAGGRRRAVFGDAAEGFERRLSHVQSIKPTVIFLAYGFNESFDDEAGVANFQTGLRRLIEELSSVTTPRFVLLAPTPLESNFGTDIRQSQMGRKSDADSLSSASSKSNDDPYILRRNSILAQYSEAIQEVARNDGHFFVDLFHSPSQLQQTTINGIHPSAERFDEIAKLIGERLKLPSPIIDTRSEEAEAIRRAIVKKNTLYFHRWRPRNDAFVYGERKDEQVIAQTEPAEFEPYITRQEQTIRKMLDRIGASQ